MYYHIANRYAKTFPFRIGLVYHRLVRTNILVSKSKLRNEKLIQNPRFHMRQELIMKEKYYQREVYEKFQSTESSNKVNVDLLNYRIKSSFQ